MDECEVEAVALVKLAEGLAVALFEGRAGIDSRRRGRLSAAVWGVT